MKHTIKLVVLLLALFVAFTFQACKKDDNTPKTKTQHITTGIWKLTNHTTNPGVDIDRDGDLETNTFDFLRPCEKDDFLTFKTNGQAEANEGATKCDIGPQTWGWSWNFNDDETKLILNNGAMEYTLLELSTTTLKFKLDWVDAGVFYTRELTYSH